MANTVISTQVATIVEETPVEAVTEARSAIRYMHAKSGADYSRGGNDLFRMSITKEVVYPSGEVRTAIVKPSVFFNFTDCTSIPGTSGSIKARFANTHRAVYAQFLEKVDAHGTGKFQPGLWYAVRSASGSQLIVFAGVRIFPTEEGISLHELEVVLGKLQAWILSQEHPEEMVIGFVRPGSIEQWPEVGKLLAQYLDELPCTILLSIGEYFDEYYRDGRVVEVRKPEAPKAETPKAQGPETFGDLDQDDPFMPSTTDLESLIAQEAQKYNDGTDDASLMLADRKAAKQEEEDGDIVL